MKQFSIFRWLFALGITDSTPLREQTKIRLTNIFAFSLTWIAFLVMSILLLQQKMPFKAVLPHFSLFMTGITVLLLNHLRYYNVSKALLITVFSISIFAASIVFGKKSNVLILLYVALILTYLLYSEPNIRWLQFIVIVILFISAWVLIERFPAYPSDFAAIRKKTWDTAPMIDTTIALFMITLFTIYFIRENQKYQKVIELQKQEIETQYTQLEVFNQLKNQLFSIISHDLRSPITAFQGIAQQINFFIKHKQPEKLQILSTQIDETAIALNDLLENLLNWSLIQSKQLGLQPAKALQLKDLVTSVFAPYIYLAQQHQIQLCNEVPNDLVMVSDENVIQLIIRNLVNNAIKFTPDEGKITVKAMKNSEFITIAIIDTGMGIALEKQASIFEFNAQTTTNTLRGKQGVGLGLNLCYEFTQLLKGSIKVQSIEGQGTTFTLEFPINFIP